MTYEIIAHELCGELVSSLMTYEIIAHGRGIQKSIALKSITLEVDSEDEEALAEDEKIHQKKKQFKKHFTVKSRKEFDEIFMV